MSGTGFAERVTPLALPTADMTPSSIDDALVREHSGQVLIAEGWMPLRRTADGVTQIALARTPDAALISRLHSQFIGGIDIAATTPWGLKQAILRIYRGAIADDAANNLWKQSPKLSARTVLSRGQKIGGTIALILLTVSAVLWPWPTVTGLVAAGSLAFLAGTAFKFFVALRGAKYDVVERISDAEVEALSDSDLPIYTVLVPVFKEANIVAQLVGNLGKLDYPKDKLEVLILLEEDDTETRDALESASPPDNFRIVTIPRGVPQTKPRACNVGLFFATGDFVVIYDAEDNPEPDQLKKALIAFDRGGDDTICVQAALNYFNADENTLTRMFTLEYNYWFDYMLPGLEAAGLPIPLGGTSNHFRTSALNELGGWDPFNVTEDADLGIRASALGYRVGVVNSTTMEEANTSVKNFIRQRSRWIKGYLQTALVHARSPRALLRQIGLTRFASFALLIGGTPITFLGVIPFYVLTVFTVFIPTEVLNQVFPWWLLWLCLLNFVIGTSVMVYLSMMGPFKRGTFGLIWWAMLNPVYWILHSIAAYKGLWQLITKPHYWEKTDHGLTSHVHG